MKNTIKYFALFSVLILLFLAACGGTQPGMIKGDEANQVLAYAGPIADNILTAMQNIDYTGYTRDFDPVMLKASNPENFDQMLNGLTAKLGAYKSRGDGSVYILNQNGNKYYIVIYPTKWEKGSLAMQLSFLADGSQKVGGLYFK
jgi:hypothetical protein